ncbi:unnamed protein product [Porites evermanni]|uniref:Uncharacterized protein n=1 Tax=Porites evermanni TaxID=104178 RepID=A0ABN8QFQ4_9CNID|nr:unnamed protein product [Porites evermanni]
MTNTRSTWPVVSLLYPNDISVSFNTDGVAVFRSSKKGELWQLYFVINELSTRIRMSPKNMSTCGLWYAPSKPNMQV